MISAESYTREHIEAAVAGTRAAAATEAAYRGIEATPEDVLRDCIEAAACVAGRGRYGDEYQLYLGGIRSIVNHIFGERYSAEKAVGSACKTMYAAASALAGKGALEPIEDPTPFLREDISGSKFAVLSRLRKLDAVAFAHLVCSIRMLEH